MSAPSVPSALPGRQPETTQSIVRTRLTFAMPLRSPGRYAAARSLAMTPSVLCSQGSASCGAEHHRRELHGVPATSVLEGGAALEVGPVEQDLVVAGEQVEGDEASPACRRSAAATREAAGWMRWPSRSNSVPPSALKMTISPSTT